jgi:hypothetical protein
MKINRIFVKINVIVSHKYIKKMEIRCNEIAYINELRGRVKRKILNFRQPLLIFLCLQYINVKKNLFNNSLKLMFMKKKILLIAIGFLLCLNSISQTSINITSANDSIGWCPSGSPPFWTEFTINVDAPGHNPTDTIVFTTYFGDGTQQTTFTTYSNLILWEYGEVSHTYLAYGTFDVTYIVSDMYGNADTVFHPAEVILTNNCSVFTPYVFVDNNSNCIYDAGDSLINVIPITLYNGTSIYHTFWSGYISTEISDSINYTAVINANAIHQLGYTLTCPASGIINFTANGSDTLYFAVNCNSNYNLSVTSSGNPFKVLNSALISVGISDMSCIPISGTYTLTMDSLLSFVYALHPPTSGSGQTYTWNYSNLTNIGSGQSNIYNMMYFNLNPSVQIGDTLCYSFSVSPTAEDIDTTNNTVNLCYPVLSAWDPNYKDVYPKGKGTAGYIPANTKLTYTIGFQNTGNDTARHVYILDTLDNNFNINSLNILYSTYPMQLYIINGKILKFDFRNINLPDSGANQMLSHGYVTYEINQKVNLAIGTQLKNKAGIYFDYNPVIFTNQTLNTIEQPMSVAENKNTNDFFSIYPNPANTQLTIELLQTAKQSTIIICNINGEELIKQQITNNKEQIAISNLPSDVYFVKLITDNTVKVRKIIKE